MIEQEISELLFNVTKGVQKMAFKHRDKEGYDEYFSIFREVMVNGSPEVVAIVKEMLLMIEAELVALGHDSFKEIEEKERKLANMSKTELELLELQRRLKKFNK